MNTNPATPNNEEIIELKTRRKRETLFWIQAIISMFLLLIATVTFLIHYDMKVEKGVRIAFAPFLSIVPLLFILTLIRDWVKNFHGRSFITGELIKNILITAGLTALFAFTTDLIGLISAAEILIAVMMAVLSLVCFVSIKLKNMQGMGIITAISEGLIIYMVFFF